MIATVWGLLILALTLAVFAAVGLRARHVDLDGFVVARGSQDRVTLGWSFLASGMGAWILFAPPEVGAFVGLTAVVGYGLAAAAPLAVFAWLGPKLRALAPDGLSLLAFLRARFGRTFHAYVVGISILYMLVFVAAELTAVAGVAAILAGIEPRVAVLATAAVTLAYTAVGGLRASLATDRWQGWLVVALVAFAAVAVVVTLDAPGAAWRASGLLEVDGVGLESAVTLIIAVTAANLFHQGYWQRVWAARDDASLRRGAAIGGLLTVPVVLAVGALGLLAVGSGVDLGSPPVPLFALVAGLPAWATAMVLLLGVALVTSSLDTLENGLASLVVAERPALGLDRARWATVLLVIPAVVVAFQGLSVLRLFLIADLLCAATVVPALSGLWRRATAPAALAGGVAGLAGAAAASYLVHDTAEAAWAALTMVGAPTLPPFLGALVASAMVTVGLSLAVDRPADLDAVRARIPALTRS